MGVDEFIIAAKHMDRLVEVYNGRLHRMWVDRIVVENRQGLDLGMREWCAIRTPARFDPFKDPVAAARKNLPIGRGHNRTDGDAILTVCLPGLFEAGPPGSW